MHLSGRQFFKVLIVSILILNCEFLQAQDSYTQKQFWPQVDAYYRLNTRFRLYGAVSGTRSNSQYTDGTSGIYVDHFALPWLRGRRDVTEMSDSARGYYLWFRTGYSYSDAPANQKKKDVNLWEMEGNSYFHLPENVVMVLRNRFDWRWVNGVFQPIYRLRLKLVRNFKTEYLTFNGYIWSEYFFYLNDNSQDRLRICFGTEIKVARFLTFETYYLYQFPHKSYVNSINVIAMQFNFYFSTKNYKRGLSKK